MKRFIVIFSFLVVLLLGGLFVAPGFVDWNKYKPQILERLHETTGHDYNIEGGLELAVLPFPHISIENLTVATPTKSGAYTLVKLDKLSVQVALLPLFSGDIVVRKLLLENPVFQMAIDKGGTRSWMTPLLQKKMRKKQAGSSSSSSSSMLSDFGEAVALNEITIKGGRFSFKDFRAGQKVAFDDINLTLQGESLFGPYSLNGEFVYEGYKNKLKLNSGRLDNLAESIAVQLDLALSELDTSLSYAGVVAFKDHLELQGETGITTQDMAAFLQGMHKKTPDYLKKPFSAKGLLTLTGDEFAYRNLKVGFSGAEASGYAVLKNFKKAAKTPLDIDVSLEIIKPIIVEDLLPAIKNQEEKNQEGKRKEEKRKSFLPESLTIPRAMTGSFNIKSAVMQFGGIDFKDALFALELKKNSFTGQLNLKAPGKTVLDLNGRLDFGAPSQVTQEGAVIFSKPALILDTKVTSDAPVALIKQRVNKSLSQNIENAFSQGLIAEAQWSVKPHEFEIRDFFVKSADTQINMKGKYRLASNDGRDLLSLSVTNLGLDADEWIKKIKGADESAATIKGQKPDIAALAKKMTLPFDTAFSIAIQNFNLKGERYSRFSTKGKLIKSQLTLDHLNLKSDSDDLFSMAGGIRDVTRLQGMDFSLQATIPDFLKRLHSFGVDTESFPKKVGRAEFLAEIKGAPEKLMFTTNLKALRATMEAAGEITNALSTPQISDLTLRLKHPNYVELARIYAPSFKSGIGIKKNLDVFASMSRKDDVYTFSQLQVKIGPTVITGDVRADVSGNKPAVTAALKFTELPIDSLLGIKTAHSTAIRSKSLRQAEDVRWSRDAINTGIMHGADISLKATANTISYGNWTFKNSGINIDLKNGNLDIKQLDGGLYGGHVAMTGRLSSPSQPRQPLSFESDILVQDVDLAKFVKSFSGSALVKAKGGISLDASLKSSGLSTAALIFDLNGHGEANGKDIVFEGFDLARLSRSLAAPSSSFTNNFTRLMDASMGGGKTRFDTLESSYTITEGVIKFNKLDLKGPEASVITKGNVSLPLWRVDLESTVHLNEPKDAPPLRASFKGPIDKPAQTFGQNAMRQYFQKQMENAIISPLLNKMDSSGALQNLLGLGGGTQTPPAQPKQEQGAAPAPQSKKVQPQPQQKQKQKQKQITPEDAIFGIFNNILGQ